MALQLIKDAYVQYEKAVNALVAITKAEGYEIGEREAEAIKFYNKALRDIRQKIEAVEDTTEYMGWCMRDVVAYRLFILGEHFTHPTCLQRPLNTVTLWWRVQPTITGCSLPLKICSETLHPTGSVTVQLVLLKTALGHLRQVKLQKKFWENAKILHLWKTELL